MAADDNTRAPLRRAVLAAGVIAGLAPAAARATTDPDAALVDLAQRWRADWAAVDGVCDRLAAAGAAGDAPSQAAAEARLSALFASIATAEEGIADLPARGAAGLAVKAALLASIYLGPSVPQDRHNRLARTLAADARRLVPCAAGVEA
jgi:hypothetical protein